MALVIELLGQPRVLQHGVAIAPPRGRKSWALLAYVLLAERPPTRGRLAELLFPDADDPFGALRWSLAELRRLLGAGCAVTGDPVVLSLPSTAAVDVLMLRDGRWEDVVDLPGLGDELLAGISSVGSAAFEIWLANERLTRRRGRRGVARRGAVQPGRRPARRCDQPCRSAHPTQPAGRGPPRSADPMPTRGR
jgi:hypothetical protein